MPRINQLTPKMIKFCEGIVSGKMPIDAYKAAYNADNMQDNTIRRQAYNLMQREDITAYINDLRKPLQNYQRNVFINENDKVKQELWKIVNDTEEKTENRLRALDIINKMNLAYSDNSTEDPAQEKLTNVDTDKLIELIKVG